MQKELAEYLERFNIIYNKLMEFLEEEDNSQEKLQNFIQFVDNEKIQDDYHDFKTMLYLIKKISKKHYRSLYFISKVEQILTHLKAKIKQTFSNLELFDIFKTTKRILLFLIEEEIITMDKIIYNRLIDQKYSQFDLIDFFAPEIEPFLDNETKSKFTKIESDKIDEFKEKRKIGENDSYICSLIRNDSIENFISYVNKENISLSSKINKSIFETNDLLIKYDASLIEYAAFFGSIQILQYLHTNGVKLEPLLWFYSINSNNDEIIDFVERNIDVPQGNRLFHIFFAVQCHHNKITEYLISQYGTRPINDNNDDDDNENSGSFWNSTIKFFKNIFSKPKPSDFELSLTFTGGKFYNFQYFKSIPIGSAEFYYYCKQGYYKIVEILLRNRKIKADIKLIFNLIHFIKFKKFTIIIVFQNSII